MKTRRIKLFLGFAFVLALFAAVFCACAQSGDGGGGDEPQAQYYTVEYTAGTGGSISGEATQRVEKGGDTQSVRAVPDSGYQFVGWSDGVESAERSDVVKGDITVADPAEDTFVFVNVYSSEIERFYYVGNSTRYFIRTVSDSSLSNCHVLRPEGSGELVSEDRGQTPSPLDIAVYSRESDMYDLADKLNGGLENPAWANVENSTPQLIED